MKKKTNKTPGGKSGRFEKVYDGKRNPIRGLWKRGKKYYAQITIAFPDGEKKETKRPLNAANLTEARESLRKLLVERSEGRAVFSGQAPIFEEYAQLYLNHQGHKTAGTQVVERGHIRFWNKQFGKLRLNQITQSRVRAGLAVMNESGKSQRTRNLAVTILRNVLNMAIADGLLSQLPVTKAMTPKARKKKRALYTPEKLEALCAAALTVSANGPQFCDFVRLMAYCGGRMSETLRLSWEDVDWDEKILWIGSDGLAKSKEPRPVNFNPQLHEHLRGMFERRTSGQWLFPSAQRGNEGKAAKSFRETLIKAREAAGQGGPRGKAVGFHDMRHLFASYCVMSGVDTMSIARWMGHKDGGKLIYEVYAHLCGEHLQHAAQQVHFGPKIIDGKQDSYGPDGSCRSA